VLGLEHVVGRRSAYLVEGPVDWLAGLNWGLPTFAICGHFPSDRLPFPSDAQAIYGVFDPDRAGFSAAERHASLFGSRWRPAAFQTTWTSPISPFGATVGSGHFACSSAEPAQPPGVASRSETAAIGPESPSVAVEVADKCRADFQHALAHLNVSADEAATLAEVLLGQRFESCAPCEIQTAFEVVRDMLRRATALAPENQAHA
jgi:hypothetical protein